MSNELTLAAVRDALPEDSVLVDLHVTFDYDGSAPKPGRADWWEREAVHAWIVRPEGEVRRVDLGPAEELEAALVELPRSRLPARGFETESEEEALPKTLRKRLWDPIAPHVGEATRVFVSSAGFLGAVPFEVLQLESGRYLVEDHAFVYLPDPAFLLRPESAMSQEEPRLLLVGDVDYDTRATEGRRGVETGSSVLAAAALRGAGGSDWQRLPFTASEVKILAGLYGDGATVLTGDEATEEAVEDALPAHDFVHIATHGFFQPEGTTSLWDNAQRSGGVGGSAAEEVAGLLPGLLSGLVFAGANAPRAGGRENGLLTAEELTWLELPRCRLVTLSACETGLGTASGGEGLIGLRRAFHQAGAETVVSSLWSVEDEATSRLMTSFCEKLWRGGYSRSEALHAAQLELLERNRSEHGEARPETWGAFVLSGDWR